MIFEFGEFIEWSLAALIGWRYLFSSAFRKKKHQEWKNKNKSFVVWEIICGVAGIFFSILIIYFIISYLCSDN